MVTYGLCKHHVTNARIMVKTGQLNYYEAMWHLKAVYEARKRIYDGLYAEGK
ncbi:hypothetical protein NS1_02 [Citrobacter phage NS1]|uniref:Uncharacterized protein n=1 Tax=Citrobacter phage NS1 TaxID=2766968 RepID=A0A7G9IRB5_9CAUD